jgi:hypothetical protein
MRLFESLVALTALPALFAQTPTLTYIANSSVKLYQVNGDCDWVQWDATINNKTPTCKPTTSQTLTKADVLGDDVPVVFENNGEMIITFGDTTGAYNFAPWSDITNTFQWGAHDPIARSTTANASDGLLMNFFLNGTHGLEILPPPQPNGTAVDMGTDNIPHAGISINGTIYLGIKTGNINNGTGNNDRLRRTRCWRHSTRRRRRLPRGVPSRLRPTGTSWVAHSTWPRPDSWALLHRYRPSLSC